MACNTMFKRFLNNIFLAIILHELCYLLLVDAQDNNGQNQQNQQNNPNPATTLANSQYPIYPADQYVQAPFIYNPLPSPFYSGSYPRPVQLTPQALQTPPVENQGSGGLFSHFHSTPQYYPPSQQSNNQPSSSNSQFRNFLGGNYFNYPPIVPLFGYQFTYPAAEVIKRINENAQEYKKKITDIINFKKPVADPLTGLDKSVHEPTHPNSIDSDRSTGTHASSEEKYVNDLYSYYTNKKETQS